MANVKITELPLISFSSITNNDVIPIVDVGANTTSKVLISDLKTLFTVSFTGGTVSGNTIFQNGLTSNTISATTYQNLPIDPNTYITGFSYNDNTFTIGDNSGNTFNSTINDVTGLTVNGTLSATTISGGTLYGDGSNLTNLNYWQYKSGSVQHFQGAKTWSINTLTADRFYGAPMEIKTDVVITDMKLFVTSPVAGASVVGIYDVIGGAPTNLITQSTAFNNGVGGLQTYTFPLPISLSKGLYVVALHTSSGMDIRTVSFNTTIDFLGLVPTLAFTENLYYSFRGAITYNATMPSTWPITAVLDLGNDARMPLIGFTIQ